MNFQNELIAKVKKLPKTKILLVDGDDQRTVGAVEKLSEYPNIELTLLVEKDYKTNTKAKIINMNADANKIEQLAQKYVELRKGKDDIETARKNLKTRPFYAMMLLATNEVDGVVGGLNFSTADILRAAFKVIGPKKGIKTISSVMIMHKNDDTYFFSDISVNPKPDANALVDIANNAAEFAISFTTEPKISFLSFSTSGSSVTPETKMVQEATVEFNKNYKGIPAIGEVQFDAAISDSIRTQKYKEHSFSGKSNVFIFPNLEAGNIGYKIAQRLGEFGAIGPIITGVNKPVNDLSRGSMVDDVVNTVLITSIQANTKE
ncbi:phosphate acetyltransferase [Mycoplasmopsis primatum]|uniref:phosphate acetyltransferase n=1 Tax=Mycoplasmopsis primatum TaxID=55604 RepID=UPI00049569AF|nr:phosphate acetyltransferase [Mycoplasmopsis primatum]